MSTLKITSVDHTSGETNSRYVSQEIVLIL